MNAKPHRCHRVSAALACVALACLLLYTCLPDNIAIAAAAAVADIAPHKLFLWRVNGGRGAVFLLGSIHVGKSDLYPLPGEIEQAFNSADYLVEEVDASNADPVAARQFWISHGRYTAGDRLENHLSDRTSMALLKPWLAGEIEHVGSTSVPGLRSKPIVDILAPVVSLAASRAAIPVLEQDGWLFWLDDPNENYRLWFLRPSPSARTHHLQVIQHDHPNLRALIAFRDALRQDPSLRKAYSFLKEDLARKHQSDRGARVGRSGIGADEPSAVQTANDPSPPRADPAAGIKHQILSTSYPLMRLRIEAPDRRVEDAHPKSSLRHEIALQRRRYGTLLANRFKIS
jgi:GrpB-like predicted nucleotidyltransferase (UPF0157 family)